MTDTLTASELWSAEKGLAQRHKYEDDQDYENEN